MQIINELWLIHLEKEGFYHYDKNSSKFVAPKYCLPVLGKCLLAIEDVKKMLLIKLKEQIFKGY